MFISPQHKFLFIHVPKTGGSAIASALRKNVPHVKQLMHGTPKHETYKEVIERTKINDLSVWIFVREPIDRFLSWHRYVRQKGNIWKIPNDVNRFADQVVNNKYLTMLGVLNQSYFVEGCKNVNVMKYENFSQGIQQMENYLNLELNVSIENASKPEKQQLTPQYESLLREFYKEDIKRFGY